METGVQRSQVSEKEACSLGRAFWEELEHLDGAERLASAGFLKLLTRLSTTKHENLLTQNLAKFGLSAGVPVSFKDVGLCDPHPILSVKDMVQTLDRRGKLDILLMNNRAPEFIAFWKCWAKLQPRHPVFHGDRSKLAWTVPILVHCDEGTSQKKKALMVIQYQALLGMGSRKRKRDGTEPAINFLGSSLTTRQLFSVMMGRLYSLKKNNNEPLLNLMGVLGEELQSAMSEGFAVTVDGHHRQLYFACLGMTGDWPALSKIGCLTRHHGRDVTAKKDGAGICHLCRAGTKGFAEWHDVTFANMQRLHKDAPLPWTKAPTLLQPLGLPSSYQAAFFKVDLFHTCHKGIFADLGANCIALRLAWRTMLDVVFYRACGSFRGGRALNSSVLTRVGLLL